MPEQGEIVLIPVPFTDLSSTKRRPVIAISNRAYHQVTSDMVVVAMTSNPTWTPYSFPSHPLIYSEAHSIDLILCLLIKSARCHNC